MPATIQLWGAVFLYDWARQRFPFITRTTWMKHFCTNQTPSLTLAYSHTGISGKWKWLTRASWLNMSWASDKGRRWQGTFSAEPAGTVGLSTQLLTSLLKLRTAASVSFGYNPKCLSMHNINVWDVPKPTPFESGSPSFLNCFHHVAPTL